MRRDPTARLGRTQKLVLHLLAGEAKTARHLSYDWPGLTESAARSALARLGDRSLIDMAGWDRRDGRTYRLTDRGAAAELALLETDGPLENNDEDAL